MSDEQFFAWLDGELDPAEAAHVEARVAADPELARLADEHRAFGGQLRAAFAPVAAAPVSEPLRQSFDRPAEIVDLASRRADRPKRRSHLPQWAAMAATLAVGVLIGTMAPGSAGDDPVELRGDKIYAVAALDRALDRQLASSGHGDVRIVLTFRNQAGALCRSFTQAGTSGLACRQGRDWQVRGLFAAPEGQSGDYRMAAGGDPNLGALIDSTIAGEPFDAAQERAALERGWR